MRELVEKLKEIVGPEYVSDAAEERWLYARDPGTMPASPPDMVVLPGTTEEVRQVVGLANEHGTPVVPMGAGLVLSGLMRALKGGIVLDMKRMNRVLEVNEAGRYAVVEAGCSEGVLKAHLKRHCPRLKHSLPDAPPAATIAGNVLIHGSGHLSVAAGYHSDMLNGLEVVLPNGEVARTGSCSVSPYWFGRAPLPDLSGLFVGWAGTTGVVTKLAIKLYPDYAHNDMGIFVCEDEDIMPDVIGRIAGTMVVEDLTPWMGPKPEWAAGFLHANVSWGAHSGEELRFKRNLVRASVKEYIDRKIAGFIPLPPPQKKRFFEIPASDLARFADVRKGGGFEYVGAIMPVHLFPDAYRAGMAIAEKHRVAWSMGARVVGVAHSMMFFYAYAFNRADEDDVQRAQHALEETNEAALELGGIPWKAEEPAQKGILARMDPGAAALMDRVRKAIDPNGIMNPGNWERGS
ncbi:MAG: FAD-binding oxidoreductase [Desulfatibacillaceae bacterium]